MKVTTVKFPEQPVHVEYHDARNWELTEDFRVNVAYQDDVTKYVDSEGDQKKGVYRLGTRPVVIDVPKGFVTDLASVPRVIWNLFPPFGKYTEAAIVHDALYRGQAKFYDCVVASPAPFVVEAYTRKDSDEIFLAAMEALGVSAVTRYILYAAVRTFGGSSFKAQ